MAELLDAGVGRERGPEVGPELLHDAHRGPLQPLRLAPRPRLRGWARADRPALLHQLDRARLPRREAVIAPAFLLSSHPATKIPVCGGAVWSWSPDRSGTGTGTRETGFPGSSLVLEPSCIGERERVKRVRRSS